MCRIQQFLCRFGPHERENERENERKMKKNVLAMTFLRVDLHARSLMMLARQEMARVWLWLLFCWEAHVCGKWRGSEEPRKESDSRDGLFHRLDHLGIAI